MAESNNDGQAQALAKVRDALDGLRFAEITVIVQDGVVVRDDYERTVAEFRARYPRLADVAVERRPLRIR